MPIPSFQLFGLPETFQVDEAALTERYKDALMKVHPDRFASKSQAEQRLAAQWSVNIQTAYNDLMDPIRRATLICEAHGFPIEAETNTAMPGFFLMRQMERHEALDRAGENIEALREICDEERALFNKVRSELQEAIDVDKNFEEAKAKVRVLMFLTKFMKLAQHRLQQAQLKG